LDIGHWTFVIPARLPRGQQLFHPSGVIVEIRIIRNDLSHQSLYWRRNAGETQATTVMKADPCSIYWFFRSLTRTRTRSR